MISKEIFTVYHCKACNKIEVSQYISKKEMEELGASLYLDDADCTPEAFMEKLEEVINNTQKMIELQNNAKKLVKYDATKNIVEQIKAVVK